jgi:hypothetical protein
METYNPSRSICARAILSAIQGRPKDRFYVGPDRTMVRIAYRLAGAGLLRCSDPGMAAADGRSIIIVSAP